MRTNYTENVYKSMSRLEDNTKPTATGNGLLARKEASTKPKNMTELNIVYQYLTPIKEERRNINGSG